jgi:hypothetical protein
MLKRQRQVKSRCHHVQKIVNPLYKYSLNYSVIKQTKNNIIILQLLFIYLIQRVLLLFFSKKVHIHRAIEIIILLHLNTKIVIRITFDLVTIVKHYFSTSSNFIFFQNFLLILIQTAIVF